jgi:RNA polymerase sigma-70 factor, ECF subfamily
VNETTPSIEHDVRSACGESRWADAATLALRGYGPELLGYINAILRNPASADDVFSAMAEQLWRALPEFAWRSSLRTWAYTIARNACLMYLRDGRASRIAHVSSIADLVAAEIRTQTASYLGTPMKDKLGEIRMRLDPDDQTLLILRMDRQLPWRDIARVFEGEDATADLVEKRAAALRKRLERLKEELREMLLAK